MSNKIFNINMDYKKTFSFQEFKKTMTRIENIASLIIIFSFFLPWSSFKVLLTDGYNTYIGFYYIFTSSFYWYSLLLIFSILIIGLRPTCKNEQTLKYLKLTTGIIGILIFFSFVNTFMVSPTYGAYIFGISSILIILGTLEKFQLTNAQPPINKIEEE